MLMKNKKDEYLMFQRSDGRGFEFIKGGMEAGETFKDTAIREIIEETDMNIDKKILSSFP